MTELRFDALKGRWVNVAPERAARPTDLDDRTRPCPFCPGNEAMTTPEVVAIRPQGGEANGPGWSVRVVTNLYPALEPHLDPTRRDVGVHQVMPGAGRHEVVIETPEHQSDLDRMPPDQVARFLRVLWSRLVNLEEDPAVAYVLVFRNWGRAAGASLAHPHSQILSLPVVPELVAREVTRSVAHLRRTNQRLASDLLATEQEDPVRVVLESEHFIAFVPFAAAYPGEIAVYPLEPAASFREIGEAALRELGTTLQDLLGRLKRAFDDPPYNFVLHTAPNPVATETAALADPDEIDAAYHWHLEIVPRLPRVDGFEWSTGLHVSTLTPEEAARRLR
jgi:UDPglucose--hexose-1-phosphate uridylyltransferase